jgi:hypothetical protein
VTSFVSSHAVAGEQHDIAADPSKPAARRTVGLPIHEARLTDAFVRDADKLMPPGPGRSLYLMLEPRVGRGRPDILILAVSSSGLLSYLRKSSRLATFTEAQVISGDVDEPIGVSASYAKDLRARVQTADWNDSQLLQARNLVHDSLAVEAKMADWRRAVRQVARFRPMAHRTAILMPEEVTTRVDRRTLSVYESGLIAASDHRLSWLRGAPKRPLGDAQKLWLLELLHRQLDDDQTPSALRISSTA